MTRILQLSDTHVVAEGALAYDRVDTGAALARAARTILDLEPLAGPFDTLVVSGDLAEAGRPEEYARFRALLGEGLPPLAVVPGNHDEREALRQAFADLPSMPAAGPIDWHLPLAKMDLIGLDSSVAGKPHGWLEAASLDFLSTTLRRLAGRPVLVFLHHPPFDVGIGHMDRQRLRNAEALFAAIEGYPGSLTIACGHVHRFTATLKHGRQMLIAPSPSHAVALDLRAEGPSNLMLEPGGFLLHEWRDDEAGAGLVSQFVPVGRFDGPHPFFPDKS